MKRLKYCLASFLGLLLSLLLLPSPVSATETIKVKYQVKSHQEEARKMLDLINEFRVNGSWYWNKDNTKKIIVKENQLKPLKPDAELEKTALKRAEEIALFYDHIRPNGEAFYTVYPKANEMSENIAYGQDDYKTVFRDWREDGELYMGQPHRRNMLHKKMKYIGIACVERDGVKYWVQAFNDKASGKTLPPPDNDVRTVEAEILTRKITSYGLAAFDENEKEYRPLKQVEEKIKLFASKPLIKIVPVLKVRESPDFYASPTLVKKEVLTPSVLSLDENDRLTGLSLGEGSLKLSFSLPKGEVITEHLRVKVEGGETCDLSSYKVDVIGDAFYYTGEGVEPEVVIKQGERLLQKDIDYNVTYEDNVAVGKAKIRVRSIGTACVNYNITFPIARANGSDFKVEGITDKVYTGEALTQEIVIVNNIGKVLVKDVDYRLKYENNIKPGHALLQIEYMGNYYGQNDIYFRILSSDIKKDNEAFFPVLKKLTVKNRALAVRLTYKKGLTVKLQYSEHPKMRGAKTVTVRRSDHVIKNLKKGKTYFVRVGLLKNGKMKWGKIKEIKI